MLVVDSLILKTLIYGKSLTKFRLSNLDVEWLDIQYNSLNGFWPFEVFKNILFSEDKKQSNYLNRNHIKYIY